MRRAIALSNGICQTMAGGLLADEGGGGGDPPSGIFVKIIHFSLT